MSTYILAFHNYNFTTTIHVKEVEYFLKSPIINISFTVYPFYHNRLDKLWILRIYKKDEQSE
jgi:hypothetical protein